MAHSPDHRFCSPVFVRCVLVLVSLLVGFSIFWHFRKKSYARAACPPCSCDCSSDISIPLEILNSSYSDCSKNPEMKEEMENTIIDFLSKELSLLKIVTADNFKRTNASIMDARKTSGHYKQEAEKCIGGMETCEESREKAEVALIEEHKLTALWEKRAHKHGWKDERRIYT